MAVSEKLLSKLCKRCGTTDRYLTTGRCRKCNYDYANKWRLENKERFNQKNKESEIRNIEKRKEKAKTKYQNNKEYFKAKVKNWKLKNKDKTIVYQQNRRAAILKSSGKLSKNIRSKLFIAQDGRCICCNEPLGDDFHLDHIIPLSKGGENIDSNVQLLRKQCNLRKSAKTMDDHLMLYKKP